MEMRSLALAVAAVACTAAQAQETDNREMEQVIVTGSRFVESIDEVPVSVTVIDRETIERQLQVSAELQNLLAIQVPGLATGNGSTSNFGTTLRGRAPLVMIDGVPQSTPLRNGGLGMRSLDPDVIERIEVVKGATSIYGNGAAGGIINYITKSAADSEFAGQASVSSRFSAVKFEDSAGVRTQGSVSGTRDQFSFVAGASRDERGVERDAEGDIMGTIYGLSESVTQNFFTKLGYRLDGDKSLQFTYNYFEGQQNADLVDVLGSVNDGTKTYAVKDDGDSGHGDPQGPRGNHNFMLKYVDNSLTDNTAMTVDAYGQVIENVFFFSPTLSNPEEGYDGGQSMIKSEKRGLRFNFNTQLDWEDVDATLTYGLDALNDVTSQPLLDGRMWVPEMDMDSLAGYLQSKWIIGNDWILKAGVRHESIDLLVDDYRTLKLCRDADTCSVPMDVKGDELSYEATTYNLALRYHINDHFSPFANYSQGADISDMGRLLRTATVNDIGLIQTEASIVDSYEIGLDTHFDDFDFSIAAFESTSELGTANAYNPDTGIYEPVRSPHKMWGYEAALTYRFSDRLSAGANYSWVEGEDEDTGEYLDARIISPPKFVAQLDWRPLDNASLALTYYHVGDRKRFEPDADGNWSGAYAPVSAYDVVNLSGNYAMDNWRFFAGIENLLNEEYFSARAQAFTYSGGAYHSMGLGTTVNAGVNYTF
ncbi:iron complex outermembrane recepter protein [Microbulbifer donghaiensis]|uniref:Iron complex outermembrane recepter protein n=1 Tax=Microbulbifer donghaiensis TaxID=494016 RepID=A0A1M5FBD2_9GAMM|nr:TonB-dependent receptor [Microbulbifer donghaiensis]SHF88920.1 iron complex outermembrane recepter protein [Microbulbifer donghaiensis]